MKIDKIVIKKAKRGFVIEIFDKDDETEILTAKDSRYDLTSVIGSLFFPDHSQSEKYLKHNPIN